MVINMVKKDFPYTGGMRYKWPLCVFDEVDELGNIQDELCAMSEQLKIIGLDPLAEKFDAMAWRVSNSRKNVSQSVQIKIDGDLKYMSEKNNNIADTNVLDQPLKMNLNQQ